MNFSLYFILGFIGTAICGQVTSSAFTEFENKLRTANTGSKISHTVNDPTRLPDFLNEMASIEGYIVPISDPYLLFRFYKATIAHYEANLKQMNSSSKLAQLNHELAEKDKEIEEFKKLGWFSRRWNYYDLDLHQRGRAYIVEKINQAENETKKARAAEQKFKKFIEKFNAYAKRDELLSIESVKLKYERDFPNSKK